MKHWTLAWAVLWVGLAIPAMAQNSSLRAPDWAQPLLAADITPTTGGRATLADEGLDAAVRVTIAPSRGGVARVIRYEIRGEAASLALRRFTGHPTTGWWLWGSDAPRVTPAAGATRAQITGLIRAAMTGAGGGGAIATNSGGGCTSGDQAFVEMVLGGRVLTAASDCASSADAVGRLVLRVSELAGSRTEEELAQAALEELMNADRAFALMAAADGVRAAFARFAAHDALIVTASEVANGPEAIAQRYANWPTGARLEWAPETGRVSARGDMGWTWGNSAFTAPDGTRTPGRYVSVWTRDLDGAWRYAFDAAIR